MDLHAPSAESTALSSPRLQPSPGIGPSRVVAEVRPQRARIRSRWAHWLAHNTVTAMMATGMTSRPTLAFTH